MTEWLDLARPLLAGLGGGAAVWLLARLAATAKPGRHGWRQVRPSALHWTGLVLGSALVGLMLYVRLFVGSARSDAETQMEILSWLIVAFALGVLVCGAQVIRIRRAGVEWRGTQIAFTAPDGERIARRMDEVDAMERRWTGTVRITFADGSRLALDEHASGARELCERIFESSEPA